MGRGHGPTSPVRGLGLGQAWLHRGRGCGVWASLFPCSLLVQVLTCWILDHCTRELNWNLTFVFIAMFVTVQETWNFES